MPIVRHHLSKREKKRVIGELEEILGLDIKSVVGRVESVEEVKFKDITCYAINGIISMFKMEDGKSIPAIPLLLKIKDLSVVRVAKITVDMGAVKPITNGADVMIPGIRRIDGKFKVGDLLLVVDEKYGKPICVGIALLDADTVKSLSRGKAVRNVHHINDEIWKLSKMIS